MVAGAFADQLAAAMPAGAATSPKITPGGTLNIGVIAEQNQPFNPAHANMDTSGFCYARAVYDPLCVTSSNGEVVYPYLAESVTPNSTFTEWTITARPGIKFHDGTDCDGDAIYANLLQDYTSDLTGPAVKALISSFSHTPGSSTVVVHTKNKWTTFPYTIAEQQIGFIAATSTLGGGYSGLPIGTGPFISDVWNLNANFKLKANSQYWRAGYPYLDYINFIPIPDDGSRMSSLQSGVVDMVIEAVGQELVKFPTLGSDYDYVTDITGKLAYQPSSNCIMMNIKRAPFDDLTVRQACAYAIDQKAYSTLIDKGLAATINGIYLPGSPYYKKPTYPAYSVSKAKALVKKLKPAQKSFVLTCVNSTIVTQAAELIQGMLAEVGITATLNPVSQGLLIKDAIAASNVSPQIGYQAVTWSQFGFVCPDTNYPWFSNITKLNFANNLDPKVESLMIEGMAATTAAERYKYWGEVGVEIDKDLPYLWTDRVIIGIAAKSYVQNWKTFTAPNGEEVLQPNQGVLFYTGIWIQS